MFSGFQNESYSPAFKLLFENDFKGIFPELFLVLTILLLLVSGVILSTSKKNKYPKFIGPIVWLGLLSIFFTLVLLIKNPLSDGLIFYNTLIIDQETQFFKIIALGGAFFSILISLDYMKKEGLNGFEIIILTLLSTSSILFLIMSADFISMYLAIEFQIHMLLCNGWKQTRFRVFH